MASKPLSLRIDIDIWNEFEEKIISKYGTTDKKVRPIIEELIQNYNPYDEDDHTDYKNLEEKLENAKDENERLLNENKTLQDNLDRLDNSTEINELHKVLSQKEEEVKNLLNQNEELTSKYNNLQTDNSVLEEKNKQDEIKIQFKDETISTLKDENKTLKNTINRLEEDIENKKKETTSVRNELRHANEVRDKVQEDLNNLQTERGKIMYAFGKFDNMSVTDRIFKRYPEEIKELKP